MDDTLIRRHRDKQALAQLVGVSPVFQNSIARLPATARSDASVLISGETGTGKELVARAIHYLSERAGSPFVPINCGALPDTLLEDELFGHERGSFTDAHCQRSGLFAQAENGTLFLDEVDTLSTKAQVALLRVLQDKKFRALGASSEQQVNIRIAAATNTQINHLVQAGRFRADLYYRLSVFSIHLPPLRERKEDILALAGYFLKKHALQEGSTFQITPAGCEALLSHSWPGNVRELENAIIRGIHHCRASIIEIDDLDLSCYSERRRPTTITQSVGLRSFKEMKQEITTSFERDYLHRLMRQHQGNVSRAVATAEKDRRDLGRLLKKYRIDPKCYRPKAQSTREKVDI